MPELPALGLIVSGGHTDLILMRDHGCYERLGRTRDDAAGEAFDKVGRLLGLGFPGGPAVERAARGAAKPRLRLPRAWLKGSDDFSFSGTEDGGVAHRPRRIGRAAAGAGDRVGVPVVGRRRADEEDGAGALREGARSILLSGGVAANGPLRETLIERSPLPVFAPPPVLCTDNGAMIAACAHHRFADLAAGWDLDPQPGMRFAS